MMNSILITGCNRGIGLGLVKQLLTQSKPPKYLIATCRDINQAEELQNIATKNNNVHILEIDLKKFDCYDQFSNRVAEIVGECGLNVLFNNAGVSTKFTRLKMLKSEQLSDALTINTMSPIMLTKVLYPVLKKAAMKNCDAPMGVTKAAVVNMTSILGSISANTNGGFYPYRCSKAALNMATKSMSCDFKSDEILVVSVHPGWVKTDMGGQNAPLEVETCTSDLVRLLSELNEEHNGKFLKHDGSKLDW